MPLFPHERIALKKHGEINVAPSLGVRLIDHNLTQYIKELSQGEFKGLELNVFPAPADRGPNGRDTALKSFVRYMVLNRLGITTEKFHDLTNFGNTNATQALRYAWLLAKYYGIGKTPWHHVFFPVLSDEPEHAIPVTKPEKIGGSNPFEEFRRDIRANETWVKLAENLPDQLDEEAIQREISQLADSTSVYKANALLLAYYAPHHAEVLRQLVKDDDFGKKQGEKDKAFRAIAYFSMFDSFQGKLDKTDPVKPFFTRSAEDVRTAFLDFKRLRGTFFRQHPKITTPYSYNAAVLVHPSRIMHPGQYPERRDWMAIDEKKGNPIHGLVVLEPSINAAKELAERLSPHFQKNPDAAFPIYDYRGRLVWPKKPK